MFVCRFLGAVVATVLLAAPACAQVAPAETLLMDFGLLGAGVAGLVIGRFGSRSRGPRE